MDMESQVYGLPRLNEPAPKLQANTTHGRERLDDYRGRWLILFSHPADFTPVCTTTEFMALAKAHKDFQAIGCDLLGLVHRQCVLAPGVTPQH